MNFGEDRIAFWRKTWNAMPTTMFHVIYGKEYRDIEVVPHSTQPWQLSCESVWNPPSSQESNWIREHIDTVIELGAVVFEHPIWGLWLGYNAERYESNEAFFTALYEAMAST
jgi:hypothetical protein